MFPVNNLKIIKDYKPVPAIMIDREDILSILINLFLDDQHPWDKL